MFKSRNIDLIWKLSNLSLSSSSSSSLISLPKVNNHWINNNYDQLRLYATKNTTTTTSGNNSMNIPPPPKRSSNVFALFVRDCFKRLPLDMPVKEKFALAGQEWRNLAPEQKEHYQKMSTEEFVKYKTAMNDYLGSLSEEEVAQYKQLKKDQMKNRNRNRIKSKLRELNYPKRSLSAYIYFIRDNLKQEYPDGNYPPVRTPEHLQLVKQWSQKWHQLTPEQKKPYEELAEADRKRYFEELEQWKQELAKPENEEKFKQLERLSKKMEVANMSEEKFKLREKRQKKVAAKVIKKRLMKKASDELKAKKKLAKKALAAKKKKSKTATKKKPSKISTKQQQKDDKNVDAE